MSRITKNLVASILVACLGAIQFGYHLGIMNVPSQVLSCSEFKVPNEDVPYVETWLGKSGFKQCIPLDDEQIGITNAIFCLGGIVGSFFVGTICNMYGRRIISLFNCLLSLIGALIIFSGNSFSTLLWGRLLTGVACGATLIVGPLFIKEVTPPHWKGFLNVTNQVMIKVGILLTQLIGIVLNDSYRWRWIFFCGAIAALVNLVLWLEIDDSPKWLFSRGDTLGAEMALFNLRGGLYQEAQEEVQTWQREVEQQNSLANVEPMGEYNVMMGPSSFWQYIHKELYWRPRQIITILLMGQQFCGISSIVFYGVKVIDQ